jgi:hypothetical protein
MATQRMTVLKDMRYGTRMLRAGDPVDMKGPDVRLYTALGAVGPRDADGSGKIIPAALPAVPVSNKVVSAPKAPAKRKAAPKKTAKKRATAKR